jgi:predicted DNA-binding transcriptional regulator YafY
LTASPALDPEQRKLLIELIQSGQKTQAQMARLFEVNRSVISRMIAKERGDRYPVKGPHTD